MATLVKFQNLGPHTSSNNWVNTAPVVHDRALGNQPWPAVAAFVYTQVPPAKNKVFFNAVLDLTKSVITDEIGFMRRAVSLYFDQGIPEKMKGELKRILQQLGKVVGPGHGLAVIRAMLFYCVGMKARFHKVGIQPIYAPCIARHDVADFLLDDQFIQCSFSIHLSTPFHSQWRKL